MLKEPKKILIIEDDKDMKFLVSERLTLEGFSVICAENGQVGLDMALNEKPDLILLDILMPIMDGMEVMKKLRQDDWGAKVPIIILTNLSVSEKIIKELLEGEPLFFLVKSNWDLKDVADKIKKALKV